MFSVVHHTCEDLHQICSCNWGILLVWKSVLRCVCICKQKVNKSIRVLSDAGTCSNGLFTKILRIRTRLVNKCECWSWDLIIIEGLHLSVLFSSVKTCCLLMSFSFLRLISKRSSLLPCYFLEWSEFKKKLRFYSFTIFPEIWSWTPSVVDLLLFLRELQNTWLIKL